MSQCRVSQRVIEPHRPNGYNRSRPDLRRKIQQQTLAARVAASRCTSATSAGDHCTATAGQLLSAGVPRTEQSPPPRAPPTDDRSTTVLFSSGLRPVVQSRHVSRTHHTHYFIRLIAAPTIAVDPRHRYSHSSSLSSRPRRHYSRVFRHGPEPCAVDKDAELPVPELAQQIVQAQHHHDHQHVVVHHFRAGHDTHQRQHHARVHARRKCARIAVLH